MTAPGGTTSVGGGEGGGDALAEVERFLRFAVAKRGQHVRECLRLVDGVALARGEVYSDADVRQLLAGLRAGLERRVDDVSPAAAHGVGGESAGQVCSGPGYGCMYESGVVNERSPDSLIPPADLDTRRRPPAALLRRQPPSPHVPRPGPTTPGGRQRVPRRRPRAAAGAAAGLRGGRRADCGGRRP
jgi:hypothetical protein